MKSARRRDHQPQAAALIQYRGDQAVQQVGTRGLFGYQGEELFKLIDDQQELHLGVVRQAAANRTQQAALDLRATG